MTSLREVARRAGCSAMTVSRVLRGDPRHRAEVKARVLAAARDLGYRPNPILRQMMSGVRDREANSKRRPALALLHAETGGGQPNPNLLRFRSAIARRCDELGVTLERQPFLSSRLTPKRVLEIVRARGVHGIIFEHFNAGDWDESSDLAIDLTGLAAVAISYTLRTPALHRVLLDDYGNTLLAIRELRALGYRRIGLVEDRRTHLANNGLRRAALLESQYGRATSVRLEPLVASLASGDRTTVEAWLARERPEVVISNHEPLARLIAQLDADVRFASLGWHPGHGPVRAGIDPNWETVGAIAVDLVIAELARNRLGVPTVPQAMIVPGTWVAGSLERKRPVGTKAGK